MFLLCCQYISYRSSIFLPLYLSISISSKGNIYIWLCSVCWRYCMKKMWRDNRHGSNLLNLLSFIYFLHLFFIVIATSERRHWKAILPWYINNISQTQYLILFAIFGGLKKNHTKLIPAIRPANDGKPWKTNPRMNIYFCTVFIKYLAAVMVKNKQCELNNCWNSTHWKHSLNWKTQHFNSWT